MRIRPEQAGDEAAIHEVHTFAFGQDAEARLVEALRSSDHFVAALSLAAVANGVLVGHALFTRLSVVSRSGSYTALALAPVAVKPGRQRSGVGSALIRAGLAEAEHHDLPGVIVLGHATYYPRFGFRPAREFGIEGPFRDVGDAFMALELRAAGLLPGFVRYPRAFGLPDAPGLPDQD